MTRIYLLLLVCIFAVAAAVPANAMVVKKDLYELGQEAYSVVSGRVIATESRWDDNLINTYVTVRVSQHMKGVPTESEIRIRVPGGEVENVGLHVSDAPWFEPGEDVIVFLTPKTKGAYAVAGWFQGKLTVKDGIVEEFGRPVADIFRAVVGYRENNASGEGSVCYKLCGYTWLVNGSYNNGVWGPGNQGWSINNNSLDGLTDLQVGTALSAATAEWDVAGACFAFGPYVGAITHDPNMTDTYNDGVNMCTFGITGGSVATTYSWYNWADKSATIEVDLVFADDWLWGYDACGSTTAFDLQNVATHEFGHWYCIGDLYSGKSSTYTMYGWVNYGWCQQRTLEQCDKDAAIAIYGACPATAPLAAATTAASQPGRASLGEISYSVKEAGPVAVKIFDITGRLVKVLINENQPSGTYTLRWDGTTEAGNRVAAGVYFYRVETPRATWSDKLILVK
jgi:hypothetical protein